MAAEGARQEPIAVLVIAAGREAELERCLEGLSEQHAPAEFVVTVVDSAPSAGAADMALRHPGVNQVVLTSKVGAGALCHRGIVAAPFQRVAILDAAYRPDPGWLEAGVRELDRGVELAVGSTAQTGQGGYGFSDMFLARYVPDRIRFDEPGIDSGWVEQFVLRCEAAGLKVSSDLQSGVRLILEGTRPCRLGPARPPSAGLAPSSIPRPGITPAMADRSLISIVLCTGGRRPGQLERCLSSLANLDDPNFEILLVDNADSPAVQVDQLPAGVKHVHEPRRGLDWARNRGVQESAGQILAFIDDDCEAHPDWLTAIRAGFSDPLVSFVTGRVRPAGLKRKSQQLFESRFPFDRGPCSRRFTRFDNGGWSPLLMGEMGTGANMAFRRWVLDRIGGFDVDLDMGTLVGGGGDLDAFARALDEGTVCQYAADAVVFHHHRDTVRKLRWQTWGYGVSQGAMCAKYLLVRRGKRLHPVMRYLRMLRDHQRRLAASRSGADRYPAELVLLELAGVAVGPLAYLASMFQQRRKPLK